MAITDIAKDVWKGMSKGVQKGRKFTARGSQAAQQALNKTNANRLTSIPRAPKPKPKVSSAPSGAKGKKLVNTKNLNVNQNAAQQVGNFFGQGVRETINNKKSGQNLKTSLKNAHSTNGKIDPTKVAGTYMAASAVSRVASGGGITKDKNGNSNLIGIPFI